MFDMNASSENFNISAGKRQSAETKKLIHKFEEKILQKIVTKRFGAVFSWLEKGKTFPKFRKH